MMKKHTGGAVIQYGSTLPAPEDSFDGTLFLKTDGSSSGLYIFNYDALAAATGAQTWKTIVATDMFVNRSGDTMSGPLSLPSLLTIATNQANAAQQIQIGPRTAAPSVIEGVNGVLKIGTGTGWGLNAGFSGSFLEIGATLRWANGKVWHEGNDGANSGLDADLLDGRQGSEYLDKLTFLIDPSAQNPRLRDTVLPFTPVEQVGAGVSKKLRIGENGGRLEVTIGTSTVPTSTWPINIDGQAATAVSAASATNATNATNATISSAVRATDTNTSLTFTRGAPAGAPAFIWGSQNQVESGLYARDSVIVGRALSADTTDFAVNAQNAVNATTANLANGVNWTGITNLGAGVIASYPPDANGVTLSARPVYFQKFTGTVPAPSAFFTSTISGLQAVAPSNLGNAIGFTVTGDAGTSALQVIHDGTSLKYRTGTGNAWSAFSPVGQQYVFSFGEIAQGWAVYPPAGLTMANLVAFIPSVRAVYYAGDVDGNDTIESYAIYHADRIEVVSRNSEQRRGGVSNYLAIWRQ